MLKKLIKNELKKRGYAHVGQGAGWPDIEEEFFDIYNKCKPYTLTSLERMYALYKSVVYVHENDIEGDLVECGVWKGGSVMLMSMVLSQLGEKNRKIYMYDTYEGMSEPTDKDVSYSGTLAKDKWEAGKSGEGKSDWCYSSLDAVKSNIASVDYPDENFVIVQGKVEETIPGTIPEKVAILRLDTDLYDSTYHELQYLYPIVVNKGVLIIDDYGYWKGAGEATDRYIQENNIKVFLNRIDYAGRMAIKCDCIDKK